MRKRFGELSRDQSDFMDFEDDPDSRESVESRLQAARAALGGQGAELHFKPPTEAQRAAEFSDLPTGNAEAFIRQDLAANLLQCDVKDVNRLLATCEKRVDAYGELEYRSDQLMKIAAPRIRAVAVKKSLLGK